MKKKPFQALKNMVSREFSSAAQLSSAFAERAPSSAQLSKFFSHLSSLSSGISLGQLSSAQLFFSKFATLRSPHKNWAELSDFQKELSLLSFKHFFNPELSWASSTRSVCRAKLISNSAARDGFRFSFRLFSRQQRQNTNCSNDEYSCCSSSFLSSSGNYSMASKIDSWRYNYRSRTKSAQEFQSFGGNLELQENWRSCLVFVFFAYRQWLSLKFIV